MARRPRVAEQEEQADADQRRTPDQPGIEEVEAAGEDQDRRDQEEGADDDPPVRSGAVRARRSSRGPGRQAVDLGHRHPCRDVEEDAQPGEEDEHHEGEPDPDRVDVQVGAQPGGDPGHHPVAADSIETASGRRRGPAIDRWAVDGRHHDPRDQVEEHAQAAQEGEDDKAEPDPERVHLQVIAKPGGDAGNHPVVAQAVDPPGGWGRHRPAGGGHRAPGRGRAGAPGSCGPGVCSIVDLLVLTKPHGRGRRS